MMSSHLCCALKMIPDFSMKTRKVSWDTFTECFDRKESKLEPVPPNWPGLGRSEVKIYLLLGLPVENPTFKIRSFTSAQAQVFRLLGRICGYLAKPKFKLLCSWKFDIISPWNAMFYRAMISIVFIETCLSRSLIKICVATRLSQSVLLLAIKKEPLNLLSRNDKPWRYFIFVKKKLSNIHRISYLQDHSAVTRYCVTLFKNTPITEGSPREGHCGLLFICYLLFLFVFYFWRTRNTENNTFVRMVCHAN